MNISQVTDAVYDIVANKLLAQIAERIATTQHEKDSRPTKDFSNNAAFLAFCKEKDNLLKLETSKFVSQVLTKELPPIVKNAELWFKQEAEPKNSEYVWIVSPFEFDIMGQFLVSIALKKENEIILSVLTNLHTQEIITANAAEGTKLYGDVFKVNANVLKPTSTGIVFLPDDELAVYSDGAILNRLNTLREQYKLETIPNNRIYSNLPHFMTLVARGSLDFVIAFNFNYHDVCAAIGIVEFAKGSVIGFESNKTDLYSGKSLFCANKIITASFLESVSGIK